MTDTATTTPDAGETIVARGGTYYRYTRYAFAALILGFGIAFVYDGFHRYPRHNEQHRLHVLDPAKHPDDAPVHSQTDINFQKVLGIVLPPAAIGLLAWTLYRSRGQYRLTGDVLSVPGHPDVPLDAVTQIDLSKWDRKGIAHLSYELPDGRRSTLTLDDFIYDRPPTDRILDAVKTKLNVTDAPVTTTAPDA
jgi:hypothetical protein